MIFTHDTKKAAFIILTVFIIVFFLLLVYTAGLNESFTVFNGGAGCVRTIIIDAGHGGTDGGTVAPDGSLEKDINLEIALKLKYLMTLYGYNVIMTREDDNSIHDRDAVSIRQKKISDIHNREKIIKKNPDAIFVSIHQNHFENSSVHGTQVFYSKNNPLSAQLAQCVQDSIVKNIQHDNSKHIKKSGTEIYLLFHSEIPSIMIECGFMSNSNDLNLLKNDGYQKKFTVSAADGIIKYYKECDYYGSKK